MRCVRTRASSWWAIRISCSPWTPARCSATSWDPPRPRHLTSHPPWISAGRQHRGVAYHAPLCRGLGIAHLADAIREGDADGVLSTLHGGSDDLTWIPADARGSAGDDAGRDLERWTAFERQVVAAGAAVFGHADDADAEGALAALAGHQILCPHRRGPAGTREWVAWVEDRLARSVDGYDPHSRWYIGRPVIVTENDYQLGLFNGDTGVVINTASGPQVAFDTAEGIRLVPPVRLDAVDTAHALTIHKSQGSQFSHVSVILPGTDSPILTRELLYTAVTRAERHVTVIGEPEIVHMAVRRRVQRASGLRAALWPEVSSSSRPPTRA